MKFTSVPVKKITLADHSESAVECAILITGILGSHLTRGMNVFCGCAVTCMQRPRDKADHPPRDLKFPVSADG